jgi:tetratricopeptide (TPR) repeat protein
VRSFRLAKRATLFVVLLFGVVACEPSLPDTATVHSPEFESAYRRGLDLLERYRLREAQREFERCILLAPAAAEGFWQLGRVELVQGRINSGITRLHQALELDPALAAARELILETYLGRGREALEDGHYEEAREHFRGAIATDSTAYEPLYQSAITAIWRGEDAEAESFLTRAVVLHPEVLELRWHLEGARTRLGLPHKEDGFVDHIAKRAQLAGRFTEMAAPLGIDKLDGGRSSAWADYDGDGDLDLAVLGHPQLAYYRNDGDLFVEGTDAAGLRLPAGGIGLQTADYDNDGDADLYVTRDGWFGGGSNYLFNNRGDATFRDVTTDAGVSDPGSSFCAAWSDVDQDGWLDIYVANGTGATGDSTNVLYHNDGSGSFSNVAATAGVDSRSQSLSAAFGDLDEDGDADLYVCNFTEPNQLFRNDGDLTFADATATARVGAEEIDGFITFLLDYNNDGRLDIFVANWSQYDVVLADRVAGKTTSPRDRPILYHNDGDGAFTDVTGKAGLLRALGTMSGVPADVDNDGWVDLYLGNGGPAMGRRDPDTFYLNDGAGGFIDATEAAGLGHPGKSHGVTFADYDRDGDLDLYVPVGGAKPGDQWHNAFYRNEGFGNHWIAIDLEGVVSNRDGIGARIKVSAGELTQYAEIASGYSFGCSNSLTAEFGLGQHTRIDEVEVVWPSGGTDRYQALEADRFYTITEGESIESTGPLR